MKTFFLLFILLSSCSQYKFEKTCISIEKQTLELIGDSGKKKTYSVSTSKFGEGNEKNSFKTPLGLFLVVDKIGANCKINTVFKARVPTKNKPGGKDCITTRIIRIHGLENKNSNTLKRNVYLHGTNREDLIGRRASYGCVRMKNKDIIDYFDRITVGHIIEIK